MSNGFFNPEVLYVSETAITATAAADKVAVPIPQKCEVVEAGIVIGSSEATAMVVALDRRIKAGSDTGRVAAALGTITTGTADNLGKVLYVDSTGSQNLVLDAGDEIVFEVTTASTGSKSWKPFLRLRLMSEINANQTDKKDAG